MTISKYKHIFWQLILIAVITLAWSFLIFRTAIADDYSCGAYGRSEFGTGEVCGATTDKDDGLINTGQALALIIPSSLILAGVVLLLKSRRSSKKRPSN